MAFERCADGLRLGRILEFTHGHQLRKAVIRVLPNALRLVFGPGVAGLVLHQQFMGVRAVSHQRHERHEDGQHRHRERNRQ